MSVTIRLQRRGKTHRPFYHIVAAATPKARDGRFIEKLGYYDPNVTPSVMEIKSDRIQHWYGKGAKVSEAVANILKKQNIQVERDKPQKKS